jgi:hypothetical protein
MPKARSSSKYGNVKTTVDGIVFHSKREAARWGQLRLLEKAGVVRDLTRQVRIRIEIAGMKVCDYIADFVYWEDGHKIVEDCKGFQTDVYKLKKKLLRAAHGITIRET